MSNNIIWESRVAWIAEVTARGVNRYTAWSRRWRDRFPIGRQAFEIQQVATLIYLIQLDCYLDLDNSKRSSDTSRQAYRLIKKRQWENDLNWRRAFYMLRNDSFKYQECKISICGSHAIDFFYVPFSAWFYFREWHANETGWWFSTT